MDAGQLLQVLLLFLLLDLAPELAFGAYWRSLVRRGVPAVYPLSALQARQAAVPDARNLVAHLSTSVALWPFIEESAFRITPYLLGGGPLLYAFSAAWALAHLHKVVQLNSHLDSANLARLATAYTLSLLSTSAFYAYATTVNPLLPYAFHTAHNALAVTSLYLQTRPKAGKPRFIEEGQAQRQQQGEPQRAAATARRAGSAALLAALQQSFGLYGAAHCLDTEWVEWHARRREAFK